MLAQARKSLRGGELWRAAALCRKRIGKHPNDAEAHFMLGLIGQRIGDVASARRSYAQALAAGFKSPALLGNLAVIELRSGDLDAASRHLAEARALAPQNAAIRNNCGNLALAQGKLAEARSFYEEALELNPGLKETRFNLGVVAIRERSLDEAGRRLESLVASATAPAYSDAHRLLGQLYEKSGMRAAAVEQYEKALAKDMNSYQTLNDLALALLEAGELQQALGRLNEAIALKGDYSPSYNNRGIVFERLERLADAITDFARAATLDQSYAEAHFNYAYVAERRGNYLTAIHQYEKAAQADPGCWQAWHNLALIYSRGDAVPRAIEYARKAVAGGHAEAHRTLGLLLLQSGQREEAVAAFKKHLALLAAPTESDVPALLERLRTEQGRAATKGGEPG